MKISRKCEKCRGITICYCHSPSPSSLDKEIRDTLQYALPSGLKDFEWEKIIERVKYLIDSHSKSVKEIKKEVIGNIGAKLLSKHAPQVVLDYYFDVANEELENEINN